MRYEWNPACGEARNPRACTPSKSSGRPVAAARAVRMMRFQHGQLAASYSATNAEQNVAADTGSRKRPVSTFVRK
jgi:hypothetical protein